MIYAEILAGGKGTRFGNNDLPKQYMMLQSKPIIIHTIEAFLINSSIKAVVVVCPLAWMTYTSDLIKKYIGSNEKIHITAGGSTRNESIINGCKYIKETFKDEDAYVVTHDAVRPFITQRIIDDNIKALESYDAVDTAIEAYDTIICVKNGEIDNIPERKYMYCGQTPQSFKMDKLVSLYSSLTEGEKEILTDACKIFVMKGQPVTVVKGESYNMKITTVFDLKMANAISEMDK